MVFLHILLTIFPTNPFPAIKGQLLGKSVADVMVDLPTPHLPASLYKPESYRSIKRSVSAVERLYQRVLGQHDARRETPPRRAATISSRRDI